MPFMSKVCLFLVQVPFKWNEEMEKMENTYHDLIKAYFTHKNKQNDGGSLNELRMYQEDA